MPDILNRDGKPNLAYVKSEGSAPVLIFLGGFASDMEGSKATFLEQKCQDKGQAFLRFDYTGHGQSGGDFKDGTIGSWTEDALDIIDHAAKGHDLILVGSSMGGWIAFLCAMQRPDVKGIVGIAAGPDFTQELYDTRTTEEDRQHLEEKGYFHLPNEYSDEPYLITRALIEDGREQSILEKGIDIDIPVRLVQGMKDEDVEWQHAHRIKAAITGDDVEVLLVEHGDHRLSRPEDLDLIWKQVEDLSA